jgi:hypothetical protein
MLTLYENKYKQEVQKFAAEQLGRRKRDDYTDGTVRITSPFSVTVIGDKLWQ